MKTLRANVPLVVPAVRGAPTAMLVVVAGFLLAYLPLKAALLLPMAVGLAAGVLIFPRMGLYLMIAMIPLGPFLQFRLGLRLSLAGPTEAVLFLVLAAWLLRMAARREIVIPHAPLLLPWLLFLGAVMLSWLSMLSAGYALVETAKWVEMLALYLFVVANVPRREVKWVALTILATGMVEAGVGLYQFVFRVGPEGFLLFGGRFLRAYGTFRQPNPFAGYLGLVLPLAYGVVLLGWRTPLGGLRRENLPGLLVWGCGAAALGITGAGILASWSRGAMVAAAAAIAVITAIAEWRVVAAFAAYLLAQWSWGSAMVGGIYGLLPSVITRRFGGLSSFVSIPDVAYVQVTSANFATVERLAHWQTAIGMWRDNPWTGVGFGNYEAVYPAYAIGRWHEPLGHAHNYYLNVAAESGLVGLLAYLFLWLSVAMSGLRAVRNTSGMERAIAAGCVGVVVHLSVHNLFDNLFVQGMYLHVAVVLGLLCLLAGGGKIGGGKER